MHRRRLRPLGPLRELRLPQMSLMLLMPRHVPKVTNHATQEDGLANGMAPGSEG